MAAFSLPAPLLGNGPEDPSAMLGTWVGWLETPAQHLRLVVHIQSVAESSEDRSVSEMEGTISSLDQNPAAIPILSCRIDGAGTVEFNVNPPGNASAKYSYRGTRDGDRISGELKQANGTLPLTLRKAEALPIEGPQRLGADSAWTGQIEIAARKIAIRFRVYDQPPYAEPDAPRILFDSISEQVNGFPVRLSPDENGNVVMAIPALPGNAKYIVDMSSLSDRIRGRFLQSLMPMALELSRIDELRDRPVEVDALLALLRRQKGPRDSEPAAPTRAGVPLSPGVSEGVRDEGFAIEQVDYRKPRVKQDGRWVQPTYRISGTLTWPAKSTPQSKLPAVVMVSGSGPQDRNGTIGSHQPFRVLAHWFAERGIATLRYDDRGVGESTGDFISGTSSDFTDDAIAVWQHARKIKGIDPMRVGMLGHSEGGSIGPAAAAIEPEIAFLILLAPPGLAGGEILATQIDRIAELQGVQGAQRTSTIALQRRLQHLALESETFDAKTEISVRQAIMEHWETLRELMPQQAGGSEEERRQRVIQQVTAQFQGLQTPWMRYFLAFDPSSSWLVMRSPTLAIWGEKDVQVLAAPNRQRLQDVAKRNANLRADLVVLPDINHLMQRAESGLPDEYDRITETIDATVLDTIQEWLRQRDLAP